jgi:hypothetical protein
MARTLGNRAKMSVTGTPGASTITLNAAVTDATNGDSQTFAAAGVQDQEIVRYWVTDGNAWGNEEALYTSSDTSLSNRVNLESSTGSLLTLTSAAKVSLSWSGRESIEGMAMSLVAPMGMF